ncbi:MAG: aminotransferase class V-fold PLP-dependent enzyme [Gemmatimonadetes bacterium]|nr:aminotransferase class V-fold PLP-dependent enzyme [Gemmatimonadota bacterium]
MSVEDFSTDFGPFHDKTWLNCAHQGPLPKVAAAEALEAVSWKQTPYELTTDRFTDVPRRVKRALGRLINTAPEEIVLGNSASYGMHLIANGIPWKAGDEVLLVRGDFPSVVLPWLALERRGVTVRQIEPRGSALGVDELRANLSPATRVFCTTWVHSFRGHALDLNDLGAVCRSHGVTFVVNTSQALGARPLDVSATPVDAITNVGFKWLYGPYGTGFCWMRPELLESLEYNQAYWLSMLTADDLGKPLHDLALRSGLGARQYDVFGTANFFNFKPWAASLEFVLDIGLDRIVAHDQSLVSRFLEGINKDQYTILSPENGPTRSTLVLLSHRDPDRNDAIHRALRDAGVYVAFRSGSIRISPHLHNSAEDVDRALTILNRQ